MKQRLTVAVAVIMTLVMIAPVFTPAATAAENVTAWVETATTTPGAGCVVDVSVEVRSSDGAVAGADVAVAVTEDASGEVLSMDHGTTSGSGIAWMVIDTSAAWDGAKTWMEVVVNGSYLGGQTIWITDGACSGNSSLLEMNGSVSTVRASSAAPGSSASSSDQGSGSSVMIPNVFRYQQQRGLSCEYAALSIATGAIGGWVSEYEFESVVPLSENPHWGYRGDITGSWGNTDDYGVYAEPLVPALEQFGYSGYAFYGGGSNDALIASIDAGHPTLVWLGMGGDMSFDAHTADGTRYQLTPYMHVMVAYGYDDGGVYLSDPGTGGFKYYDWGTFMWMWNIMDGMALGVSG